MKKNSSRQFAGVWLDNQKAMIIASDSENNSGEYVILEKIKAAENQSGGSEHSINNAKQTESLKYFKSLSSKLVQYDEIFIFGPGKSQEQFQNHLQDDAQFKNKQITIDSAEHLTDPQMLAKVREFFKSHQS